MFRQLLKIKTFIGVGSFKEHIKDLTDTLSNFGPPIDPDKKSDETSNNDVDTFLDRSIELSDQDVKSLQNLSSMRVNLFFQGVEIRSQTVEWIRESRKKVLYKATDKLSIEAQEFKITIHMSDIDEKMGLLVLMSELRIKDLGNPHYFYRNMIKVAPTKSDLVQAVPEKLSKN